MLATVSATTPPELILTVTSVIINPGSLQFPVSMLRSNLRYALHKLIMSGFKVHCTNLSASTHQKRKLLILNR